MRTLALSSTIPIADGHQIQYAQDASERTITPVGYIDGTSGNHYAYIHDHQGNNRATLSDDGWHTEVMKYYPFGAATWHGDQTDRYRFGGKELDRTLGLDLYDFEARMYDPVLARFCQPDPMAGKYPWLSPYAYCANNPIRYIDPSGQIIMLAGWEYTRDREYFGNDMHIQYLRLGMNIVHDFGSAQMVQDLIDSPIIFNFIPNNNSMQSYTQQYLDDNHVDCHIGFQGGFEQNRVFSAVSHEFMHATQSYHGQGGASIWNEVEAYTFETVTSMNSLGDPSNLKYNPNNCFMNANQGIIPTPAGETYANAMNNLAYDGFRWIDMFNAVQNFKKGSTMNCFNIYSSNIMIPMNRHISLLHKYNIKIR